MKIKLLVKAVMMLLSDEKTQKKLKTIIGVILSPLIVIILFLGGFGSASSDHNHAVVRAVFNQTPISTSVPIELKTRLELLQDYFVVLNELMNEKDVTIREEKLDKTKIRSIFFAVYLNQETLNLSRDGISVFVECFVEIREEAIPIESDKTEEGKDNPESVKVITAITNDQIIYQNLNSKLGIVMDDETISIAKQIAQIVDFGATASSEGQGSSLSVLLKDTIETSLKTTYVGGMLKGPFDFDWHSVVTSEFGPRDPITLPDGSITSSYHSGIDFGVGLGTPILSLNSGTVVMVRNFEDGLGYFLVIDHGGGILSVYAHCSRILVGEGDKVSQGQKVAEVGSTGYSTGNHLHLEIWENGKAINPRSQLE